MSREFPPDQARVLTALEPGREERVPDLAARLGMDQALVSAAAVFLAQAEMIVVREDPYREWVLKETGVDSIRRIRDFRIRRVRGPKR